MMVIWLIVLVLLFCSMTRKLTFEVITLDELTPLMFIYGVVIVSITLILINWQ